MSRTKKSKRFEVKARQLEALMFRAYGYSVTQIAERLEVTRRTVFNYLKGFPTILTNAEVMEELKIAEQQLREYKLAMDIENYRKAKKAQAQQSQE